MKKKTLRSALYDLQDGEYLYIYGPTIPIGARRTNGTLELEEIDPSDFYRGWRNVTGLKEFDKFKDNPWRIFKSSDEFWLEFRHDYLEPALEETILSGNQYYKTIQEDVDLYSGQAVTGQGRYQGYYLVGATYGLDDFYYLYWSPTEREFKFASCIGPIEDLDPLNTLSMEQIRGLREDIKYIHDAPFPSDLLLSPLG